jgi:hypothetical protein
VQTFRRQGGALTVAVAAAVALAAAGCGTAASPALSSAPPSVEALPTVEPVPPAVLAKLPAESRALLEQLDGAEWARADLTVTADAPVRRLATEAGLRVMPGIDTGQVLVMSVLGPARAILRVAADAAVEGVVMHEDERAQRVVAPPLPPNTVLPVPGQPYVGRALVIPPEQRAGDIPAGRRAALMAALEKEVTTIDGEPYLDLQSSESCEPAPAMCRLAVIGQRQNANLLAQADSWEAHLLVAPTGVQTWVVDMGASSLPRWLAREAERIARTDPATAAVIAGYTTISTFRWASGGNLVIFVEYSRTRPCQAGGGGIGLGPLECTDVLTVAVDPVAGTVVDVDEAKSRF